MNATCFASLKRVKQFSRTTLGKNEVSSNQGHMGTGERRIVVKYKHTVGSVLGKALRIGDVCGQTLVVGIEGSTHGKVLVTDQP